MRSAQTKVLVAMSIMVGVTGYALPHARAAKSATGPAEPGQGISIIMPAKPQPPAPGNAQISTWVRHLTGGNTASQTHAQELLIAAGDAALPALTKALHGPCAVAVHKRLRAALDAIYTADALRGPLVSVQAQNASLKSILAVICDEAGIHAYFAFHPAWAAQRLSINVRKQPFWKLMLRIARATGVGPTSAQYGPAAGFYFDRHGLFSPPAVTAIHGSLAMVIRSTLQKSVYGSEQNSGRGHRELIVKYCGLCVPAAHTLVRSTIAMQFAVDNRHKILTTSGPIPYPLYGTVNAGFTVFGYPWQFTLSPPSPKAQFIAKLRANVTITVATAPQVKICNNLATGKGFMNFGAVSIKFSRPARAGTRWKERVIISAPAGVAKSSRIVALMAQLANITPSPFHFRSAHGQLLPGAGGSGYGNPKRYVGIFFVTGGKPARVSVQVYRHTIVRTIPFEFKNVPLPR